MKVLHVITTLNRGGAENQLLTLTRQQVKDGLEVSVLPLKGTLDLGVFFRESGVEVIENYCNLNWFIQTLKIRSYLKRSKFTIIHAHLPRAEVTSALASQNRFVITRHNSEIFFPGAPNLISTKLSRWVTKRSYMVICISKAVLKFISDNHELATKATVVYYGRDVEEIYVKDKLLRNQFLKELDIGAKCAIYVTLARLTPQKDIFTLIKAFKLVSESNIDARLIIGGEGELKVELQEFASKLGVSEKIRWLGNIKNTDELYNASDLFVFTSIYEGFGLVLLEAMTHHIPIVAAKNTSIPEVIGPEHPGLVETGNFIEFADKMKNLIELNKSKEVVQLQDKRLNLFDITKTSKLHLQIYEDLIQSIA